MPYLMGHKVYKVGGIYEVKKKIYGFIWWIVSAPSIGYSVLSMAFFALMHFMRTDWLFLRIASSSAL